MAAVKTNATASTVFLRADGTFNDDFYRSIFNQMNIQQCLNHRLVCSAWKEMIDYKCSHQMSLKLFDSFTCLEKYAELLLQRNQVNDEELVLKPDGQGDDLVLDSFFARNYKSFVESCRGTVNRDEDRKASRAAAASRALVKKFPRVKHLVICFEPNSHLDVHFLLQHYSQQLTSLALINFTNNASEQEMQFIMGEEELIFPALESLHLHNAKRVTWCTIKSVLPKLKRLSLDDNESITLRTLLARSPELTELSLDNLTYVGKRRSETRPIKLTKLNIRSSTCSISTVKRTLDLISKELYETLTCLKLDFFWRVLNFKLSNIVTALATCSKLTDLSLCMSSKQINAAIDKVIVPLDSVKKVTLKLEHHTDLCVDLAPIFFAAFPNASRLWFEFDYPRDSVHLPPISSYFTNFAQLHPNLVRLPPLSEEAAYLPVLGHHAADYKEVAETYEESDQVEFEDEDLDEEAIDKDEDEADFVSTEEDSDEEAMEGDTEDDLLSDDELSPRLKPKRRRIIMVCSNNLIAEAPLSEEDLFFGIPLIFLARSAVGDQSLLLSELANAVDQKARLPAVRAFNALLEQDAFDFIANCHRTTMLQQICNAIKLCSKSDQVLVNQLMKCFVLLLRASWKHDTEELYVHAICYFKAIINMLEQYHGLRDGEVTNLLRDALDFVCRKGNAKKLYAAIRQALRHEKRVAREETALCILRCFPDSIYNKGHWDMVRSNLKMLIEFHQTLKSDNVFLSNFGRTFELGETALFHMMEILKKTGEDRIDTPHALDRFHLYSKWQYEPNLDPMWIPANKLTNYKQPRTRTRSGNNFPA